MKRPKNKKRLTGLSSRVQSAVVELLFGCWVHSLLSMSQTTTECRFRLPTQNNSNSSKKVAMKILTTETRGENPCINTGLQLSDW